MRTFATLLAAATLVSAATLMTQASAQDAPDPIVVEAEREKARQEARAAASVARTRAIEAEVAAASAAANQIPDTGIEGETKAGDGAGAIEAAILSSRAMRTVARRIVTELPGTGATPVLIITEDESFSIARWQSFRVRRDIALTVLSDAKTAFCETAPVKPQGCPGAGAAGSLPEIAAGLTVLNRLSGFLQSNYQFAEIEITPDEDLLATALSRELICLGRPAFVPTTWLTNERIAAFRGELTLLQSDAVELARFAAFAERQKTRNARNAALSARWQRAATIATTALTSYTALTDSIFAGAAGAEPAIGAILREYAISESLRENAILWVDINATGGTSYTRRNFWTFLGAAPFHVSSGAVVSYRYFEPGADARVAAAGVIDQPGRYQAVSRVGRTSAGDECAMRSITAQPTEETTP